VLLSAADNDDDNDASASASDFSVEWPGGDCRSFGEVSHGFLRAGTVLGAACSVPRTMSGMVSMPGMGWLRVMRSTMWLNVVG
jgi:hypothetical protein